MPRLAWIIRRYAPTVPIVKLSHALHDELLHRAMAAEGRMSDPKQRPPGELLSAVILLAFLGIALSRLAVHLNAFR